MADDKLDDVELNVKTGHNNIIAAKKMKRQINADHGSNGRPIKAEGKTTTTTTKTRTSTVAKKKGKRTAVEKVEEERKNITGGESSEAVMENLQSWVDQWPWFRGSTVDEQMSWGSIWLPFWDLDYMGDACTEMFSDVVWDDDIWNLKGIDKIPNE
ncbi:unnamed protein product [Dovyalis caffra]|uniref:Uncharacterized protein n=1 Tax=Dovyalis caffra TaxID=77055 RepID=A0AAV1QY22_9ROSI|nr:unnamed protein product [Dovyalis caffra]